MLIACAKVKLEKGNAEKELEDLVKRFSDIAADLGVSKDLEDECLSYEHIPSGIDNISIILRQDRLYAVKEARVVGQQNQE